MKLLFTSIALHAAVGHVLVSRAPSCSFHLQSSLGPVDQISDGLNRVNQTGLTAGQYSIDATGGLTDASGRGCIFTAPTSQFQCDMVATPLPGFSVGCDGTLAYENGTEFIACPTGDNGSYDLYATAPGGQQDCVSTALTADNCQSGCPAAATASAKTCPLDLSGVYEYPHLIVPVDSSNPNNAYGTSYNGTVSSTISSIFNFDIKTGDNGKTCSLVFLLPEQSQLETSSFEISGSGDIDFFLLDGSATASTTYATAPGVEQDLGMATFSPGHTYSVATFPCPGGKTVTVEAEACGDTYLNYFQDYNPSPIGLYITIC